jgi:hypothetical protein
MPAKSGLDMSDSKNSSCVKPGRSSQSGSQPAAGASRTRSAGTADCGKAVVDDDRCCSGAKATAAVAKLDKRAHFMMLLSCRSAGASSYEPKKVYKEVLSYRIV